jgi:hypothetical protein
MNDLHNFLSNIVKLWGIHQYREDLFKRTLAIHDLGTLRRVCSQGYTSSLLYKKEIQWVYDFSKSSLYDGDIHQYLSKKELPSKDFTSDDKPYLMRKIIEMEAKTINLYQALLNQANLGYDAVSILSDHLEKLNDISLKLKKELKNDMVVPPQKMMQVMPY